MGIISIGQEAFEVYAMGTRAIAGLKCGEALHGKTVSTFPSEFPFLNLRM